MPLNDASPGTIPLEVMQSSHIETVPDPTPVSIGRPDALSKMSAEAKARRKRRQMTPTAFLPPPFPAIPSDTSCPSSNEETALCRDEGVEGASGPSAVSEDGLVEQCGSLASRARRRSFSVNATDNFFDHLNCVTVRAPVSVYVIPTEDAEQLQRSASEIGFHTAVVVPETAALQDELSLVIGTEDDAVKEIRDVLAGGTTVGHTLHQGSALARIIGGAVIGAAAVFAGLSYV